MHVILLVTVSANRRRMSPDCRVQPVIRLLSGILLFAC